MYTTPKKSSENDFKSFERPTTRQRAQSTQDHTNSNNNKARLGFSVTQNRVLEQIRNWNSNNDSRLVPFPHKVHFCACTQSLSHLYCAAFKIFHCSVVSEKKEAAPQIPDPISAECRPSSIVVMHLRFEDLAAPIQAIHPSLNQEHADKHILDSEQETQTESSTSSSSSHEDSSSFDDSFNTTQRHVTFAEQDSNTVYHYLTEQQQQQQQQQPTIEECADLWYTRQDFRSFRIDARRRAAMIRQLDMAAQQQDDDNDDTANTTWSSSLLADYDVCRQARSTERLEQSRLLLQSSHCTGKTVGLELHACKQIARDLMNRRRHLLEQIDELQCDTTLKRADRERIIAKTSCICSRSARLFAQHLGQMAAGAPRED